jgi:hypothetical protein
MNHDHLKPATVRAILRVSRHTGKEYLVALCPIGHVIDSTLLDRNFGGSRTESDWSAHQHGAETRWDRLASKCDGAGH